MFNTVLCVIDAIYSTMGGLVQADGSVVLLVVVLLGIGTVGAEAGLLADRRAGLRQLALHEEVLAFLARSWFWGLAAFLALAGLPLCLFFPWVAIPVALLILWIATPARRVPRRLRAGKGAWPFVLLLLLVAGLLAAFDGDQDVQRPTVALHLLLALAYAPVALPRRQAVAV